MKARINCPECGKKLKVPTSLEIKKGKCPECGSLVNISDKDRAIPANEISAENQLLNLLKSNADNIRNYGDDLKKVYGLMKNFIVKKKEFEEQKRILRDNFFKPLLEEALNFKKLDINKDLLISLWAVILDYLPSSKPGIDPEVILNLYPRYEFAAFISLISSLSFLDDHNLKKEIILTALSGETNNTVMKKHFTTLNTDGHGKEFAARATNILEMIKTIDDGNLNGSSVILERLKEDFNFGFSWISFHLE